MYFLILLGIILAGILMAAYSGQLRYPLLKELVFWIGIAAIVVGVVVILTPVFVWLSAQIKSMTGA
jgi:hypothetical protein